MSWINVVWCGLIFTRKIYSDEIIYRYLLSILRKIIGRKGVYSDVYIQYNFYTKQYTYIYKKTPNV